MSEAFACCFMIFTALGEGVRRGPMMCHNSENTTVTSEPPLQTKIDPTDPSWTKSRRRSIVEDSSEVEVDKPF